MNTKEMESEVNPGVYFQSARLVEALNAVSKTARQRFPKNYKTIVFNVEGDAMGLEIQTSADMVKMLFMDIDQELQGLSISRLRKCSFKLLDVKRDSPNGEERVSLKPLHEYAKIEDGDTILVRLADTAPVVTNLKD